MEEPIRYPEAPEELKRPAGAEVMQPGMMNERNKNTLINCRRYHKKSIHYKKSIKLLEQSNETRKKQNQYDAKFKEHIKKYFNEAYECTLRIIGKFKYNGEKDERTN